MGCLQDMIIESRGAHGSIWGSEQVSAPAHMQAGSFHAMQILFKETQGKDFMYLYVKVPSSPDCPSDVYICNATDTPKYARCGLTVLVSSLVCCA